MQRLAAPQAAAALILLALAAGLLAWLLLAHNPAPPPAAAQATYTDYDADDDGLIEITTLAQLNAVRWDPDGNGQPYADNLTQYDAAFPDRNAFPDGRMGCSRIACLGYELQADLDFDTNDDNTIDSADAFPDWTPLPSYSAAFNGNGHTITDLTSSGPRRHAGLFGILSSDGIIRNLGLLDPHVTSTAAGAHAGALVGQNFGQIAASYASGGRIAVTVSKGHLGGLVGTNRGQLRAVYATAAVSSGSLTAVAIGGLVGLNGGGITAGYAAAPITAATTTANDIGGLVGYYDSRPAFIDYGRCDLTVAGQSSCIGQDLTRGRTVEIDATTTTALLQAPTGYAGIYAQWNIDTDGDALPDNPWTFGGTSTYPTLQFVGSAPTDYDADDDRLIEITTLTQLNIIRWDLDGDGYSWPGREADYAAAFPNRDFASREYMGCPQGRCRGYELAADLDFDTNDDNTIDANDQFPNWRPIGGTVRYVYADTRSPLYRMITYDLPDRNVNPFVNSRDSWDATFDGNGHTISNLRIRNTTEQDYYGLFGFLSASAAVRNLGIIDADVVAGTWFNQTGILAGSNRGASITSSYVQGGSVTGDADSLTVGGLVGTASSRGEILGSYSTAAVNPGTGTVVTVGGLAGGIIGSTVIASYAAGPVTCGDASCGGFAGSVERVSSVVRDNHCDAAVHPTTTPCVHNLYSGATAVVASSTTAGLRQPTGYTGPYANWNLDLDGDSAGDDPWTFGSSTTYPQPKYAARQEAAPPPPPQIPTATTTATTTTECNCPQPAENGPGPGPGNGNGNGNGNGDGPGNGNNNGNGDGNGNGGNGGSGNGPGSGSGGSGGAQDAAPPRGPRAQGPAETAYNPQTDHPEIYANAQYGMTATCATPPPPPSGNAQPPANSNGQPQTDAVRQIITFNLGTYTGRLDLSLSLWNGEHFQGYESHGLTTPTLNRQGATATLTITTDPEATRFLLNGYPHGAGPPANLLLGYADCHTDDAA